LAGSSATTTPQEAVRESAASAQINAEDYVGGLVGRNDGTVCDSQADGKVSGSGSNVGDLIGGGNVKKECQA
jgi:hypothetical protein